jgi:ABC-type antimicrobial peptide transport system permease subunit
MSAIVILLGIVSKYIPKLKELNKATLTLITSLVLGIIAVAFYGMTIEKAVLSVLFAVMAYNNLIKQAITKPVLK